MISILSIHSYFLLQTKITAEIKAKIKIIPDNKKPNAHGNKEDEILKYLIVHKKYLPHLYIKEWEKRIRIFRNCNHIGKKEKGSYDTNYNQRFIRSSLTVIALRFNNIYEKGKERKLLQHI